jgi:hypothetical protein
MRIRIATFVLFISTLIPLSACWGTLAHRAVAYIAQKRLSQTGADYVAQLLEGEDIAEASLWADHIKFRRPLTRPWHYIDAEDDPPNACGVNYRRDCVPDEGCIISAIVDMVIFFSFVIPIYYCSAS